MSIQMPSSPIRALSLFKAESFKVLVTLYRHFGWGRGRLDLKEAAGAKARGRR